MKKDTVVRRLEAVSRAGMHARPLVQIVSRRMVRIGACLRSHANNGKSITCVTALAAARGKAPAARAGAGSGIAVSLGGEPAAPVTGLGLRLLTPAPPAAAGIKRIVHNMPAPEAAALAFHARKPEGPDRTERLFAGFAARTPKRSGKS